MDNGKTMPEELIPPASNSLASRFQKDPGLTKVVDPNTAKVHQAVLRKQGAEQLQAKAVDQTTKFNRGDLAYDTEKDLKVVVVKHVGYSNMGTPFYRVVEGNSGESWIQIEKKLKPRRRT